MRTKAIGPVEIYPLMAASAQEGDALALTLLLGHGGESTLKPQSLDARHTRA